MAGWSWRSASRTGEALALAVLAAMLGCAPEKPTAPTGPFALSGHVRLVGALVEPGGHFAGNRVVDDADSVLVELRFGHAVIGRAVTTDGSYRFGGLQKGTYTVAASVIGDVADETTELTIVDHDVVSGDRLVLSSFGDLYPVPNPSSSAVEVLFAVADTARVRAVAIDILDMKGQVIQRVLSTHLGPGLQQVFWDGRDDAGQPVTGPLYWITYESGTDQRAQLLFR